MNLKKLTSTKKGQLILCCSCLGVVWLVILLNFVSSKISEIPNKAKIAKVRQELSRLEREKEKVAQEYAQYNAVRKEYRMLAGNSWINSHDGTIETNLRRKVREAAQKVDFKLNNIGSVRTARMNQDFFYADVDISGNGDLSDVMKFLAQVAVIQPRLSWRRLDLRPDLRFRRNNNASGSANLAAQQNSVPETRLNFSGTLRVLGYEGKLTVKELKITRPKQLDDAPEMDNNDED